jgi:predicted transcriptional regulator
VPRIAKVTIPVSAADYRRLAALARKQDRPITAVLSEAITEYVRHASRTRAHSVALGHSRRGDVDERADELLAGLGRR